MPSELEHELVARAAGRPPDTGAFVELYDFYLPRIYGFIYRRIGERSVAEDLTAATFEKAWRHRARYRRDLAAFGTWLMVIARNTATDYYRRARPHVTLEHAEHLPAGETPEDIAEKRSEADKLARLLATLADRDRELLALRYGAGLSNREIARASGLSESNVGTILHRAIAALRARW
jgi:RNA polymerase sigma-70 factor (ECF subfamily)